MNKKLFIVRTTNRRLIVISLSIAVLILVISFFAQFFVSAKKNFLKFHDKVFYTPANKPHKGFFGKTNDMLGKALLERTNIAYRLDRLDTLYKRLHFYYPADSVDYLVSPDDIRLIGFTPEKSEREFYFNSYLATLLDLQRKNLSARYFNIKFDRLHHQIVSITVDSSRFKLALQNSNWLGTVNFVDPFAKIQPGLPYLIAEHKIIPLFSTNVSAAAFIRTDCQWQDLFPLRKNERYGITDYERFYEEMNKPDSTKSQLYLLDYGSSASGGESSIRIFRSGKQLMVQTKGSSLEVSYDTRSFRLKGDESRALPADAPVINLTIRPQGLSKAYKATIVKASPFSIASRPENATDPADRIHMDPAYYDLFSAQEISQLEAGIREKDSLDQITLSSNILLSRYLEDKLKQRAGELMADTSVTLRSDDEYDLSVCMMDISTGEVIAAPYYSNIFPKNNANELTDFRNFNLIRHNIGSTFKPLLSFAAAVKYPSLAKFTLMPGPTSFVDEKMCKVLGYPVPAYGMKTDRVTHEKKPRTPSFWDFGPINRVDFLATSHDNYPVGLTMLALTETDDSKAFAGLGDGAFNNSTVNQLFGLNGPQSSRLILKNGFATLKDISTSSFVQLLSNLYAIRGQFEDDDRLTYDPGVMSSAGIDRQNFFSLYPDLSNLGTESFDNIASAKVDFRNLEMFVLGEQNNVWSNIKLAEAYSRLLSKRRINATLLARPQAVPDYLFASPARLFNKADQGQFDIKTDTATIEKSWNEFLDDWQSAVKKRVSQRLLWPAYDNFNEGVAGHDHYDFYCKTGTPEAEDGIDNDKIYKKGKDKIWINEGLFTFGITNKDRSHPRGLVGVIYIKHLTLRLNQHNRGISSRHARDFFTPEVFKKIMFYNKNRF